MNAFSKLFNTLESNFDKQFGDTFLITPMTQSQTHSGSPDENNPPYTLTGILDDEGSVMGVIGTRYKAKVDANLSGLNSIVSFSMGQFCKAKPVPQKNWIVETMGACEKKKFRIGFVRNDGESRTHAYIEAIA